MSEKPNFPAPVRSASLISKADIDAQVAEGKRLRAEKTQFFDQYFFVISLEDWLGVIRQVPGIRPVPTTMLLPKLPTQELLKTVLDNQEPSQELTQACKDIESQMQAAPGAIPRFDHCAPDDIKFPVNKGGHAALDIKAPAGNPMDAIGQSFRMTDLLMEHYFRTEIPVFKREWIPAKIIRGYPLEFRVWTLEGQVSAICNYYPQRDLTQAEWDQAPVQEALRLTREITKHVPKDMRPDIMDPDRTGVTFTTDWIVGAGGQLYWLECGPGTFRVGAHPCCFEPEIKEALTRPTGKVRERWSVKPEDFRITEEPA